MRKRLVGLGLLVHILAALHGVTGVVRGIQDLAGKTVGQGVAAGDVSAVDDSDGLTVSCNVDSDVQGRGTLYTAHITVSDDSGEVYALDASRYESGVK